MGLVLILFVIGMFFIQFAWLAAAINILFNALTYRDFGAFVSGGIIIGLIFLSFSIEFAIVGLS